MIERLLTYKNFCKKFCDNKTFKALIFREQEWKALEQLRIMLKPTQLMTTRLQAQDLTVIDTIFYWNEMMDSLKVIQAESLSPNRVGKLIKYIEIRQTNVFQNRIALAGTYLGQHLQYILPEDDKNKAKEVIRMAALKRWDILHGAFS